MMTFVAVCILIVKAPFLLLKYLLTHRFFLVILIIGIVVITVMGHFNSSNKTTATTQTNVPSYAEIAPTKDLAPYVIATTSRIYYALQYQDDGHIITLSKYYNYDKKSWALITKPLTLDRKIYGEIRIYKR